ncbi:MAG TPA: transglycosylase domain-containing protein [Candidatus Saccharimonadales bacterium]|nr:transglycosylase domain-containing protein [Candidatus Saccharimonadales bacterium]
MNDFNRGPGDLNRDRRRPNKNIYTTRSGKTIKLNQSLSERMKATRNARATRKATYLSTLPKNPVTRFLYRLHPKRLAAFWFSREGALMALKITGIGIVVCFFVAVGVFAYFRKDLPKIKDISGDRIGGSITYYDRTGQQVLWQDYDGVKRIPVEGKEMSDHIKNATIAVEDKNFYKHGAFDVQGLLRAGITDVVKGEAAQGGSTITQQLVKLNQQWTDDRTITRKVKELILAVELEREYSKADILTGYLNIAPYGGVEYGVESAARDYFGTTAKNLSLPQAAFLAAIPKSPGIYSPYNDPKFNPSTTEDNFDEEALIGRQHYVLNRMVEENMITRDEAQKAKKVDLLATIQPLKPKYQGIQAPYFVLSAKSELEKKYGAETVRRGGWRVITTLDMNMQKVAEDKVNAAAPTIKRYGGDEAAFVAADVKTGQIVSLVGGIDFGNESHGFLNFASNQKVSPGSSFKPYDYAALINYSNNVGAGSVLYDTQGALPGYPCTNKNSPKSDDKANCLWNYDFMYPGPMTLRYALGGSRNVPAVKAMLTVGTDKTIKMASDMMGNPDAYKCYKQDVDVNNATRADEAQCFGSAAIGDGAYLRLDDHVTGLATMSRNGSLLPKTYILKITDGSGKPVHEFKTPKAKQIIKPDAAYIVNMMASDPNASYMNASAKFHHQKNGWHFAIKTGTTNDNYDGLMTSWSTQYASVSWIGYHTRQKPILGTAMENITGPINRGWMEAAHANLKAENWAAPTGTKTLPAFVVRGKVSRLGEIVPSPSNDIFPSWYTPRGGNTSQTVDRVSRKVATSCTPELARQTLGNSNANSWNVDQWAGGRASSSASAAASTRSNSATDDVHNCNDSPPSVTVTAPPTCSASGGGCTITATVAQGTHALSDPSRSQFPGTLNFTVNGQVVKTFTDLSDSPSTRSFTYVPTSSGDVSISAQVIDSALYQATDSATFNASAVSAMKFDVAQQRDRITRFEWSGGTGPYSVRRGNIALPGCSNVQTNYCEVSSTLANKNDNVTLTDSGGESASKKVD